MYLTIKCLFSTLLKNTWYKYFNDLDASFHLSVKSHEFSMLCTKFVQVLTWIELINLMFSCCTQNLVQSYMDKFTMRFNRYTWNKNSVSIYHVKYKRFVILHLDLFAFHISVKSHIYHVKYTDFI